MSDLDVLPAAEREALAAARRQQTEDQILALANIIEGILDARRSDPHTEHRRVDAATPEGRQALARARRILAECHPVARARAQQAGHEALCSAVEALLLGGHGLTPAQRNVYRVVWSRALAAYHLSLEGQDTTVGGTRD